jgi:hypothetical protein
LNFIEIYYQYNEVYYKYTQMHWKYIQILWCLFKYIYLLLRIHSYILICILIPSKYITTPSKILTYFWHILQYHYYTPISFHIHPYTSIYVEIVFKSLYSAPFCLVTTLFLQNCHGASLFYQDDMHLPWHLCWNPKIKHIPRIPYILWVN